MKKYSKGDFDYIKFDTDEEIEDFVKTVSLLFFVDKDGTLYCFDYYQRRSVRFDKGSYKWVMDSKTDLDDFEGFDEVDEETTKALFNSMPQIAPFVDGTPHFIEPPSNTGPAAVEEVKITYRI